MLALILQRDATPIAHRLEFRMIDIGGDDHATAGDFVTDQFGRELFALGDVHHLFRDFAGPREVHLREVAVAIFGSAVS